MSGPKYRLQTLGGLVLTVSGTDATVLATQRKRLALLALLAAEAPNGGLPRDRVLAMFWPEADLTRARNALNQLVFGIRSVIGDDSIIGPNDDLRLNPDVVDCDLPDFRRALDAGQLEAAVAVYHGPFLDGVYLREADAFERWVDDRRREIGAQYADALERVVTSALERGVAAAALHYARRLQAVDDLNTRSVVLLMRALDASGDRVGAIRLAESHAATLRQDLKVEPSPSFSAALSALRDASAKRRSIPAELNDRREGEVAWRYKPVTGLRPRLTLGLVAFGLLAGIGSALWKTTTVEVSSADSPARIDLLPLASPPADTTLEMVAGLVREAVGSALESVAGLAVSRGPFEGPRARDASRIRRYRIEGAIGRVGDSVELRLSVFGASPGGDTITRIQPVRVRSANVVAGVRTIAQRVVATVAMLADVTPSYLMTEALPPSIEAYSLIQAAARAPDVATRVRRLRQAAGTDSSYTWPLVLVAYEFRDAGLCDSTIATSEQLAAKPLSSVQRSRLDMYVSACTNDVPSYVAAAYRIARLLPGSRGGIWPLVAAGIVTGMPTLSDSVIRENKLQPTPFEFHYTHATYHAIQQYQHDIELLERSKSLYPHVLQTEPWRLLYVGESWAALKNEQMVQQALRQIETLPPEPELCLGAAYQAFAAEFAVHGDPVAAGRLRREGIEWYEAQGLRPRDTFHQRWFLALLLIESGRGDSAAAVIERLARTPKLSLLQAATIRGALGVAAAMRGDRHRAGEVDSWLAQGSTKYDRGNATLWRARIALASGDTARALSLARRAAGEGYPRWRWAQAYEPLHHIEILSVVAAEGPARRRGR